MRKRKSMMSEYWILCPLRTVAVVLTRKGLCESVSDHPLWTRHHLSLSPLPRPTPPTPTSPIAFVGTHQSVPSHSRPTRRPSRSMRPGWGFKGTRDPFGKGQQPEFVGKPGPGSPPTPASAISTWTTSTGTTPEDRGHSQWTPIVRGSATRGRRHLGISIDFIQPVPKTCWPIRKSSAPGRRQIQGARVPRNFSVPDGAGSWSFPNILRKAETSLLPRWSATLTHAAQQAFPASLLDLDCAGASNTDGDTPSISQPETAQ